MRWLFLIVLSLNLIYMAWQMFVPAPGLYAGIKPIKGVNPIVLLSEFKAGNGVASDDGHEKTVGPVPPLDQSVADHAGKHNAGDPDNPFAETVQQLLVNSFDLHRMN